MTPPDSAHETNIKENNGKQGNSHDKKIEYFKVIAPIIGTIIVAIFGYYGIVVPPRMAMRATQTAEAKSMMPLSTSTPVVTKVSSTAKVQNSTPIPQPTNTPTPVTPSLTPIPPIRIIITDPAVSGKTYYECSKGEGLEITLIGEVITLEIEDIDPANLIWKSVAAGFFNAEDSGLGEVTGRRALYSRPAASVTIDSIQIINNNDLICDLTLHFNNSIP